MGSGIGLLPRAEERTHFGDWEGTPWLNFPLLSSFP